MKNRLLKLFGLGLVGVFALTAAAVAPANAGGGMEMKIENQSKDTLYYETGVGVENAPQTIAPGTTSSYIKGPHKGSGGDGQATYVNATSAADVTCSVTLAYGYEWNDVTDKCDNKKFTLTTNKGSCSLVKDGDCTGSSSCDCRFKFTE